MRVVLSRSPSFEEILHLNVFMNGAVLYPEIVYKQNMNSWWLANHMWPYAAVYNIICTQRQKSSNHVWFYF